VNDVLFSFFCRRGGFPGSPLHGPFKANPHFFGSGVTSPSPLSFLSQTDLAPQGDTCPPACFFFLIFTANPLPQSPSFFLRVEVGHFFFFRHLFPFWSVQLSSFAVFFFLFLQYPRFDPLCSLSFSGVLFLEGTPPHPLRQIFPPLAASYFDSHSPFCILARRHQIFSYPPGS